MTVLKWAIVGGSGFVGSAMVRELHDQGTQATAIVAPRLQVGGLGNLETLSPATVVEAAEACDEATQELASQLQGFDVIVNAAGLAEPDSSDQDALLAANAVLPAVIALAADKATASRVIHLSSAAVLGPSVTLNNATMTSPVSMYGHSKALGEHALTAAAGKLHLTTTIVRGTSIQGPGRATTRSLQKVASSPLASVASPGDWPSPVGSVSSLARFVLSLGEAESEPIVVQPWDGATVRTVLELASGGRVPLLLPTSLCRAVVSMMRHTSRALGNRFEGHVRRIELMWFGQGWSEPQRDPSDATRALLKDALSPDRPGKRRTLGILSQWFDPETGPAALPGVYARAIVDQGLDVDVLTGYPNYPDGSIYEGYQQRPRRTESPSRGIRVTRVPLYASHDASASRRAANYLSFAMSAAVLGVRALRRADAVWVYNSPITVSLPLMVHTAFGRRPYFLHVQDIWPDSLVSSGMVRGDGFVTRLALGVVRRIVHFTERRAAVIGVISPSVKPLLLERNRRLDPAKIVYVPNPTDEEVFKDVRQLSRADHPDVPWSNTFTFMYIGAVGALQGLDAVIDAFKKLEHENVSLVIVGDGTALERLRERARAEAIPNLHLIGRVRKQDVPRFMATSDVQVVSLADDPFLHVTTPSKIPTTLAAGKPMLGHLTGDGALLIEQAGSGIVAKSYDIDALESAMWKFVALAPAELASMADSGVEYYHRHLSAASCARIIIESLAATKKGL